MENPETIKLSPSSSFILIISRVLGSGIFATPGAIVTATGSIGLTLTSWIAGSILAGCALAVSMEYGCMLPWSGGDKVYLEYTYPRPRFLTSTLVATHAILLGFTASNCIVFAKYTLYALAVEPTTVKSKVLAVLLLTAITVIHAVFVKSGIYIQNALGWTKIVLIVAMALTGLWVILFHSPDHLNSLTWDGIWEGSNWNWGILSTALFKVLYSYAGLDNVNNVLNEVHRPVQTLKVVGPAALITAAALYLLANLAYFLVIPIDEIKKSGELVAALFFERIFGVSGRVFFPLAIAISAAGNVMVVTFALSRVNQEIARSGFLPFSSLLSSSRPFNSPLGGLIVHYIPSLLVITLPPHDVYNFILDVEGYPAQLYALAITLGLLLLRYKQPDRHRPFKAWLPAVCLRGLICVALLGAPFFGPRNAGWGGVAYAVVGVGVILLGVLYWFIWTVVLPRIGGYVLTEKAEEVDGRLTTRIVRYEAI
ncbi:hypothetical protein ASPWEDRAFT_71504 [Aspergillus wentii DTO 134E9]|uniref:Amino acid permease/ SLC12A domain-containing protein n=1 Tax=Aspergillus wentii DTO 134E9 TaxID=1073089 RepID=A0A1L9RB78_ASPWE|nr:uncharacterized protein ASPWEDRAFT_71504 [Aspergillus wentii DTO 134E9]OJJ32174.1 hypothetical protein ASPWEDRAFT_71504 [Aspergillus wentii DTO 134E9]